jgi:hypothetical protein
MTTLFNLTTFCLRSLVASLLGFLEVFQLAVFILRVQEAAKLAADIGWTPARPIHAPTLEPSA